MPQSNITNEEMLPKKMHYYLVFLRNTQHLQTMTCIGVNR